LDVSARPAFERIDSDFDVHLERICSYLRRPSVSLTGEGIEAGAEATAGLIEAAGGSAEIVPTRGHPAVLGRFDGAGPTLLRYGMYDVQPAEEPDWTTPPFAAEIRLLPGVGQSVVARGAANSKGCLAAFLCALESLRKVGDLPVRLVMLVDGEEEMGSPSLPKVIEERAAELRADAAFDLDLTADMSGRPEVWLGCKGILSFRLVCQGGAWGGPVERALHSSEGVVVSSPAWSLVRALASLVGPDETPRLAELSPSPVPPEDKALVDTLAEDLDVETHLQEAGAQRLRGAGEAGDVIRALLYEPAVNLNGVSTGFSAGGKSIIPHRAEAALDVRLPHGRDPAEVMASIRDLVRRQAPEVRVEDVQIGPSARTSPSSPVARAMIESHRMVGREPRVWPSSPWWAPYYLFTDVLGLPFACGGAGHSARAHSSDEYATVAGLREHMHQSAAFLFRAAGELEGTAA
jgi:acetylornithine deacetylase/succinyl-diaminopimelate desuccinylase-like protein